MTLRRLIVLGVCAGGVSLLYLLPGAAHAPVPASDQGAPDEPLAGPSARLTPASMTTTPQPSAPITTSRTLPPGLPVEPAPPDPAPDRRPPTARPDRSLTRGATPFSPTGADDEVAPAPVATVTPAAVTQDRLTLRWPATSDNVGVVGYRVLLDGYEVAATPDTYATVRWFNDDAREHVIQVRALDAAGNESLVSPGLLVARPTPAPSPSATPAPSVEPDPVPATDPTPQPAPSSSSTEPGEESPPGTPPAPSKDHLMTPSPTLPGAR